MANEIIGLSVVSSIAKRMVQIFPFPEYTIYREAISGSLRFPHFFVFQLTVDAQEERKNRWWIDYLINIRYRHVNDPLGVSGTSNLQENLDSVGLQLLSELDYIDWFGRPHKILNPRTEKVDGVLHYFCNIRIGATKAIEEVALQMTLELNQKIKQ